MVARDEFRAIAKNHGTQTLELYVLETKPEKSHDDITRNLPARLDLQARSRGTRITGFFGSTFECHRRFDGK